MPAPHPRDGVMQAAPHNGVLERCARQNSPRALCAVVEGPSFHSASARGGAGCGTHQHLLTRQDQGLVAGIRGVEWDAVELPSQFMENWCYDDATIEKVGVRSGSPAPTAPPAAPVIGVTMVACRRRDSMRRVLGDAGVGR